MVDNGAGNLPGAQYYSGDHTNALVPLYAKGAGSERFASYVAGTDPELAARYGLDARWTGEYVDNTAIFHVMSAQAVPLPAAVWLLGPATGLLGLLPRRRAGATGRASLR